MTHEDEQAPPGIDVTVPSIARVYDHMLGGKDNFAADRAVTEVIAAQLPDIHATTRDSRSYIRRVVQWLVGQAGIRQIVDIGSGLPTAGNVHEIAQAIVPDTRVVYIDNDPIVLVHGRALLTENASTTVIQADIRDPDGILDHPDLRAMIDLDAPVGLIINGVLHHLADAEGPADLVHRLRDRVAAGSYLSIANFFDPENDPRAPETERAFLDGGLGTGRFRTRAEQAPFFEGLELVEPGLIPINEWKTDLQTARDSPVHGLALGGVGRKP